MQVIPVKNRSFQLVDRVAACFSVVLLIVCFNGCSSSPLYGQYAPSDNGIIFLGDLAIKGERGLLKIPQDWLLRMRYNPFYDCLEDRVLNWVGDAGGDNPGH